MEQNKYREAMESIITPPELKEKTRRLLITATAKRKSNRIIWSIGTLAACAIAAIGLYTLLTVNNRMITNEPGYESGDFISFTSLSSENIESPIRFAPPYPLRHGVPLEEFTGILPETQPGVLFAPEGEVTAYFSQPAPYPDAVLGRVAYQVKENGLLTAIFTDDSALLLLPVEIAGSQIDNMTVGLAVVETGGIYIGVFEKDGFTFLLTSEGIDDQEFIQMLKLFLSV